MRIDTEYLRSHDLHIRFINYCNTSKQRNKSRGAVCFPALDQFTVASLLSYAYILKCIEDRIVLYIVICYAVIYYLFPCFWYSPLLYCTTCCELFYVAIQQL